MSKKLWRVMLGCAVVLALLAITGAEPARAQVLYGSLRGTVTDQSGAVVPKAHVTITSPTTGLKLATDTNDAGFYSILDIATGTYNLAVTASGFKPTMRTGVRISVNEVAMQDVQLEVGAVTQEVTVQAEAAMLQTTKADVHTELGAVAIQNLPLNAYRNFQTVMNLVPGATPGVFQNAIADTPERALSFNINGTNRNNNNTRLDGASDVFVWLPHHALYIPPAETVEEVNVATSSFDAEQGMTGGAAVTVVTKSGTNSFHGSWFWYHADQALRARQVFELSPQKGKSILNDFGGTLGGPIKRDKLFFFGSWDGLFERDNRGVILTLPTADIRAGDFTATRTTIYDPSTGNANGTGRLPFANQSAIPIDPISAKILSFVPLPNLPGTSANYFISATQRLNRNNYDSKIDWIRKENHRIWGKYSTMRSIFAGKPSLGDAVGTCLCDGGLGEFHSTVNLVTLGHTWTLSPNFLVDGNAGFTRMSERGQTPDFGKNFNRDVLGGVGGGIPGTNDGNQPSSDPRQTGWPLFSISGYSAIGNPEGWNPAFRNDWSFTNSDNFTWLRSKHEIRFGFDAVHHHLNHWQPEQGRGPRGGFTFNGESTALKGGPGINQFNAFAQFLLGLDSTAGKSIQFAKMTAKEWQFGWYVADRWRATPRLTATLGLRYEYYPLMTRDGLIKFDRYDFDSNVILLGGVGGQPTHLGVTTSKKLFAPRIGLAYQLNDATVIRSGFGISYNPLPLARPLRGSYPLVVASDFFGTGFTPFGSLAAAPVITPVGGPYPAGIPRICCPDVSPGQTQVPGAALILSSPASGELKRGYIESWNFTIERRLPWKVTTSVAYVGTQTVHQFIRLNLNASLPGTGNAGQPLRQKFGRGATTNLFQGGPSANYHSLQVAINRPFTNGLLLKGAYTYGHAINWADDDGAEVLIWNDPNILKRNRASAGYDRRHVFQLGYVYELPVGQGKKWANGGGLAAKVLGSWQANGIIAAYAGTPFTITAPGALLNAVGNAQTASQVAPVRKIGDTGIGLHYYDPSSFAQVTTAATYGNTGRNYLYGPGFWNTDFSLFRHFKLTEKLDMQFRAEVFNLFNHPHFNNPSNSVTSGTFMQITSAQNDERQFRFALRFGF